METVSAARKDAAILTLCQAFANDPGLSWFWPDHDDRQTRLPPFFDAMIDGAMLNGLALCSTSADAVALWRLPGSIAPDQSEIERTLPSLARAFGTGHERSRRMGETLRAHQPHGFPWWYLQFIGVSPAAQGSGLGGVAIRAGLARARTAGMPVLVEVMNPANLAFYRHEGFETLEEFDIPDAGPHVWTMLCRP